VYGLQCDEIVIEEATFEEFCNPRNVESNPEVTFRGIQKSSGSHHVDFKNVDILRIFSPYVSTVSLLACSCSCYPGITFHGECREKPP
jgi:hypothetical protein